MKRFLILSLLALSFASCRIDSGVPEYSTNLTAPLWDDYDRYKEPVITNRFFKHSDIVPLIEKHAATGLFKNEVLGTSTQGRSIHHLTIGQGKTKVLLWSQMHGDESTATMALFDVFNFFSAKDGYDSLRNFLLSNLELHFVPMLNPDGAQVWQRRNALDIDINRDARLLATPEGKILTRIAKELKPTFGFNLHDQSVFSTAGYSRHPATISFLAPAYNYEKDMNDVRIKATQLILVMDRVLQTKIPGKVAKYDDEHDPRCFGDNFQGLGISTVLIESGGYPRDIEKQHIRKVNFYALLTAFESLAKESYANEDLAAYDTIPENSRFLYDLVIRNVAVEKAGQLFTTHLGINRSQMKSDDYRSISFRGIIDETGDMDRQFGYEEMDGTSLKFTPAKVKTMRRKEWESLNAAEEISLIRQGFLFAKWTDGPSPRGMISNHLLNLINTPEEIPQDPRPGQSANFLLTRDNTPVFAVANGFLIDLAKDDQTIPNTMGY
jgi:hypothetical protein